MQEVSLIEILLFYIFDGQKSYNFLFCSIALVGRSRFLFRHLDFTKTVPVLMLIGVVSV